MGLLVKSFPAFVGSLLSQVPCFLRFPFFVGSLFSKLLCFRGFPVFVGSLLSFSFSTILLSVSHQDLILHFASRIIWWLF